LIAFVSCGTLVPILLPWLPGRALSWKGTAVGLIVVILLVVLGFIPSAQLTGRLDMGAWILLMPAIGAFMAMNFTGATTYTSLSGVKKEMRVALPLQITAAVLGLALWVTARFV
jgi:hypothetical protein